MGISIWIQPNRVAVTVVQNWKEWEVRDPRSLICNTQVIEQIDQWKEETAELLRNVEARAEKK